MQYKLLLNYFVVGIMFHVASNLTISHDKTYLIKFATNEIILVFL